MSGISHHITNTLCPLGTESRYNAIMYKYWSCSPRPHKSPLRPCCQSPKCRRSFLPLCNEKRGNTGGCVRHAPLTCVYWHFYCRMTGERNPQRMIPSLICVLCPFTKEMKYGKPFPRRAFTDTKTAAFEQAKSKATPNMFNKATMAWPAASPLSFLNRTTILNMDIPVWWNSDSIKWSNIRCDEMYYQ